MDWVDGWMDYGVIIVLLFKCFWIDGIVLFVCDRY